MIKKNSNNVLKKELVYFLLHSESNRKSYVKIGKSDSETGVVARLKGCQTGNPIKLILLGLSSQGRKFKTAMPVSSQLVSTPRMVIFSFTDIIRHR